MTHRLRKLTIAMLLISLSLVLATIAVSAPVAAQETVTGAISGDVVSESNTPLPGATIELYSTANTSETPIAQTTASSDGSYTLVNVDPGEYHLTGTFNGKSGSITAVVVQGGTTTVPDIVIDGAESDSSDSPEAGSNIVQEDSVLVDGSTVTISHDGTAAVAIDSFSPESIEISGLSGNGQSASSGAIWNGPSGDTVSFTLTPTGVDVGETVEFDVTTDQTMTVELEVIEPAPFDFGVELQQEATVTRGGSTAITTYPNNLADRSVSDATLELMVDSDDDGQFSESEAVTARSVEFESEEYREIDLTYSGVQLEPGEYEYQARISKENNAATSYTTGTLTVSEAADSPPSTPSIIEESTVRIDGSTVTINHGGAAVVAIDSFTPGSVEVTDLSGIGQQQPGGAIWYGPSGNTVNFTLTPTGTESGETVEFDVTTDQKMSVGLEVVDSQVEFVPDGVDRDVAVAVADEEGKFTPSSIALAISENQLEGSVNGVDVSPSDFALIIVANKESNSSPNSPETDTPEAVGQAFIEELVNKDVQELNELIHPQSPQYPIEESDLENIQADADSITVESVSVKEALQQQSDNGFVPDEAVSQAKQEYEDIIQPTGSDDYQLLSVSAPVGSSSYIVAVKDDSRWYIYN